jgi:AAA+ superfamily predicted ATPase
MLARAIATEAGAAFFDLSPKVIEDKGMTGPTGTKNATDWLIYKTYLCAADMSPSVIYIDEVDQVFIGGKKKGKQDPKAPSRIKKALVGMIKTAIKRGADCTEQDRILIIGCTSTPFNELIDNKSYNEFVANFDEKVWVSYPEYGSRKMLWEKFMKMKSPEVSTDQMLLELATLAQVSEGFSAGSIKQTVDRVLTARRIQQLKARPLKVKEFLGPLSRTAFCTDREFNKFQDFDFAATGQKDYYDERRQAEEEPPAKGKK